MRKGKFLPMSDERKNKFQLSKQQWTRPKGHPGCLRPIVQIGFIFSSILLGFQFHSFVLSLSGSVYEPVSTRPSAVEAYLPISSLMSLIYFVKTGHEYPNRIAVDKKETVRSVECTACFSCIGTCEVNGAIGFSLLREKIGVSVVTYAAILITAFFFSAQIAQTFNYWQSETPAQMYKALYSHITEIGHP